MTENTTTAALPKTTETPPWETMSLQEKFIKLREAVPSIAQRQHSEGVKYKFAKIFDVYGLLTPAMNQYGVNFDIVAENATKHAENGDPIYYTNFQRSTRNGNFTVWVYEADLTIRWTNANDPEDILEVTLHAIGTNDGGPDKAKGSAWTYCLKYYLFEKFGIDQGDDDPDMSNYSRDTPLVPQNGTGDRNVQPQQQNTQNECAGSQKLLTEAQLSRMYRKGKDIGFSQSQVNEQIVQQYGHQDPHNLTRTQYDEICNKLDAAKKQQERIKSYGKDGTA